MMLLKPWRELNDLKCATETFETSFDRFMSQAPNKTKMVVANVQYYFECSEGAKADRKKMNAQAEQTPDDNETVNIEVNNGDDFEDTHYGIDNAHEEITEDDIKRARLMKSQIRDRLYGESAVALGYDFGFFEDTNASTEYTNTARKMDHKEGGNISAWKAQLKAATQEQMNKFGTTDITEEQNETDLYTPNVESTSASTPNIQLRGDPITNSNATLVGTERTELARLNKEQHRAHNIIEERLKEHIATSESYKVTRTITH